MKHSTCKGPQLLVQLAIAHLSDSRHGWYPKTTAKQEKIAKVARLSLRRTKGIIAELISKGRLFIHKEGKGQDPHTYELPIREVSKLDRQAVSEMTPVIREDPYTQNTCAGDTAESGANGQESASDSVLRKIIGFPNEKKRHKKA